MSFNLRPDSISQPSSEISAEPVVTPVVLQETVPDKPKMYVKRMKLSQMHPTQNGLKKRTRKDVENLTKSLQANETQYPLFAALIGNAYQLIDGHFRHYVLKKLHGDDYEIDVIVFEGLTLEQAKKQCLVLSARYGKMLDVEEWIKVELPTYEIDLISLGFAKETEQMRIGLSDEECGICPACGKPMKPERKVKSFGY